MSRSSHENEKAEPIYQTMISTKWKDHISSVQGSGTKPAYSCSNSHMEAPEQCVRSVQT